MAIFYVPFNNLEAAQRVEAKYFTESLPEGVTYLGITELGTDLWPNKTHVSYWNKFEAPSKDVADSVVDNMFYLVTQEDLDQHATAKD